MTLYKVRPYIFNYNGPNKHRPIALYVYTGYQEKWLPSNVKKLYISLFAIDFSAEILFKQLIFIKNSDDFSLEFMRVNTGIGYSV